MICFVDGGEAAQIPSRRHYENSDFDWHRVGECPAATLSGSRTRSRSKKAGQLDWEITVQVAKQEAQIVIYAAMGPYHPQIFTEFKKIIRK